MDLLMVRERETGRFLYTERLERRAGETSWEYVRRSVRREAHIRARFAGDGQQVIMGWGADSVEDFLKSYPEYGPVPDGTPDAQAGGRPGRPEGESVDR
ncbi:MAG: hypothetical protein AVDCRST_MAG05-238 [uncultured Rubrobacteraceae bacterium]|uniref:Uncharacterized protein n=1 Tax=uncultured Rubrobacteraceae bacterium TaxID=349277 RepID=A0A6J4REL4_9ACTN|nr:MAG: hypothetical protein AVDCRST_MAG05-238 [uncultured Rubrobacteraceae bacterium]